jgi:outer membrane protein OmpA-like peptidoglycan-associated protein
MKKTVFITILLAAGVLLAGCGTMGANKPSANLSRVDFYQPDLDKGKAQSSEQGSVPFTYEEYKKWKEERVKTEKESTAAEQSAQTAPETQKIAPPASAPAAVTGRSTYVPALPPRVLDDNPGYLSDPPDSSNNFVTKNELESVRQNLQKQIDINGNKVTSLGHTVEIHDERLANLWLAESQRSGGLMPIWIGFGTGQTILGPQQKMAVKSAAAMLNAVAAKLGHPIKVSIRGYSSLPGQEVANLKRSDERAKSVDLALRPLLQNVEVLEVIGVGESDGGAYQLTNQCVRIFPQI